MFYSYEETQRFRQEYRLERRRAAEAAASENESKFDPNESNSVPSSGWSGSNANDECVTDSSVGRHRISRVIVKHKNTLKTFFDQELFTSFDETSLSINNNPDTISNTATVEPNRKTASDDFFDNDSFWSGQITWY